MKVYFMTIWLYDYLRLQKLRTDQNITEQKGIEIFCKNMKPYLSTQYELVSETHSKYEFSMVQNHMFNF